MTAYYNAAIPGTILNETDRHVMLVAGVWQLCPGEPDAPYVDDPNDPGGPTKWGQSQRGLRLEAGLTPEQIDALEPDGEPWPASQIKALTVDWVVKRWQPRYWQPEWAGVAQVCASKLLDMSVNMGPKRAVKLVQEACCDVGHPLDIDGDFGFNTLAAVNSLDPQAVVNAAAKRQLAFYENLHNPAEMPGWRVRAAYLATAGTILKDAGGEMTT